MKPFARFIFVAVLCLIVLNCIVANEQFLGAINTECACPGEQLTFTCTTVGTRNEATIWTGSAFECAGNEIALLHQNFFRSGGTSDGCNREAIVGKSISVVNETCFTSELNVTVSSELNFTTVSCFLDSQMQQPVGMAVITVADACSEVQPEVYLIKVNQGKLTFSWSPLASNCPTVQYWITSDCGNCPLHTTNTSITCVISSIERNNCTFSVRGALRNFNGTSSSPIIVTLKVPDVPEVNLLPVYSHNNDTLIRLIFAINQMDFFIIYDGISGSVESYAVNISSDASSLSSVTPIPANDSKCSGNVCEYELKISPDTVCPLSSEFNDIMISVLAENRLGPGLPTDMIPIECINRFVRVNINRTTSTLTCLFLGNQSSIERTCSVEYRICDQEHTFMEKGNSTLNTVTLKFSLPSGSKCYAYTVRAADDARTVAVVGMIDSRADQGDSSTEHNAVKIAVPIVVLIIAIIVLVALGVPIGFHCHKRCKGGNSTTNNTAITEIYRPTQNDHICTAELSTV